MVANDRLSVDEAVERIVAEERTTEDAPPTDEHRRRVGIELHHVHLPRLAEHGIVDYDEGDGAIRYDGDGTVSAYLDLVDGTVD